MLEKQGQRWKIEESRGTSWDAVGEQSRKPLQMSRASVKIKEGQRDVNMRDLRQFPGEQYGILLCIL